MAGDDEAGSGATTTAETDPPRSEDATTPDAPPSDREGADEAPSGGDDDPPVGAAAAPSEEATDDATNEATAKDGESDDADSADSAVGVDKAKAGPEFDVGVAETRLQEVEEQIDEGQRALADVVKETDPEPDGPPVAEGEGAANAPPG